MGVQKSQPESFSEEEIQGRMNAAVRKALSTPPTPKVAKPVTEPPTKRKAKITKPK